MRVGTHSSVDILARRLVMRGDDSLEDLQARCDDDGIYYSASDPIYGVHAPPHASYCYYRSLGAGSLTSTLVS